MKKRIAIILSVATLSFALSSCLKETQPTGSITQQHLDEVLDEHPEKFATIVQGIYADIQTWDNPGSSHSYFGQKSFDYLANFMGNDIIMTNTYWLYGYYWYLLDYWQETDNATLTRWREYYRHIANANKILRTATADATDPTTLQYRAVALGIRAYAYLHLSYVYGFSYYVGADDTIWGKGDQYDHSKDPMVPLVDENMNEDQPLSTVGAVMDFLIKDLEEAYAIFSELGAVRTADPSDVDGCVVANYLARAYMIKHDWTNAAKYAKVVMDKFRILNTSDEILQGFSDISLPDVVWGCDITPDNATIYESWFSQMDYFGDGYAGIGVWRAGFGPFVERIAADDIRRQWFLTPDNELTPEIASVLYQSIKFIGAGRQKVFASDFNGEGWELGDYIYLRSEEAYFMYAECLAHQGDLEAAAAALEKIMTTRQPSYVCEADDKASLLEEINYQKRVEFWGEGIGTLDNRRLNIPVDRTDETWPSGNNHYRAAKFYAEQEDPRMRYQIPISEQENNKMIKTDN